MTTHRTRAALFGAAMLGAGAMASGPARAALVTYEHTGAIQTFEVTVSGDYRISAFGAQGGGSTQNDNTGGLGAQAEGTVSLAAGDVLTIVVGGAGETSRNSGGGGGSSYVFFADPLMALVIAGGGGGAGFNVDGSAGHSGPDGTAGGTPGSGGAGGTDGQGGSGVVTAAVNFGAGGGGFLTAGLDGGQTDEEFPAVSGGGQAGSGSALGGAGIGYFGSLNVAGDGGFGGGGGGGNGGGGGGGGYSGGGGGGGQGGQGGGGGSFVTLDANDVLLLAGVRQGHGLVTIEFLPPAETAVPEPGSLALLGLGLAGLAALRRRL